MKGDFSRIRHNPDRHYTQVLKQQGRVDLDADWNEYSAIRDYLAHTRAKDIIGTCGVPKRIDGFKIDTMKLYDVFSFDNSNTWAVGSKGTILKRENGDWNSITLTFDPPLDKDLHGVCFINTTTGWAVGDEGTIIHYDGSDWTKQNPPADMNKDLHGICFIDAVKGWAVGKDGTVLYTDNGGSNWHAQKPSPKIYKDFHSVCILSSGDGWIAGEDGTILRTTNFGEEWLSTYPESSVVNDNLYSIFAIGDNDVWAVGGKGTILKWNSGTSKWDLIEFAANVHDLHSVFFTDADNGWAVGNNGTILHTTDGGLNWTHQAAGVINDLFVINSLAGTPYEAFAVGSIDCILHTSDSGTIWELADPLDITDLSISPGRIYVDGILCELEKWASYLHQPDYNDLLALDMRSATQTDLIYLDVWQRHITAVEDPDIREIALGGPDTTTRLKTIWQVKVEPNVLNADDGTQIHSCHETIDGWPPPPGMGRMTTSFEPEEPDRPCQITPEAGYRGLENRLYRVEIHKGYDPDNPGDPITFKWSRDNGSVVFSIENIKYDNPNTEITLSRLGRDQVLTLHKNDWIEIIDDQMDLSKEPPGILKQIIEDPDETNMTLTVQGQITGISLDRHPKVRRWDQTETESDGTVLVSAGPVDLEDGIKVEFSGSHFRTGDYWIFAARTATGDVDRLKEAPPHGPHHHYCKLALIEYVVDGESVTYNIKDCRKKFIQDNCCTQTVAPGDDIQAAIDALPESGGCVCLKTGTHTITRPIEISTSNVSLHGEGPGTSVERTTGANLLNVFGASNIIVERINFILREYSDEVGINRLIDIDNCDMVVLQGCRIEVGPEAEVPEEVHLEGITVGETGARVGILDNTISGVVYGVKLALMADRSIIEGNSIVRQTHGDITGHAYGIEIEGTHCIVRNNRVNLADAHHAGIWTTGEYTLIEDNIIDSTVTVSGPTDAYPIGILTGREQASSQMLPDGSTIRHNILTGFQNAIRVSGPDIGVQKIQVLDNQIIGALIPGANGDFAAGDPCCSIRLYCAGDSLISGNNIMVSDLGIYAENSNGCLINANDLSGKIDTNPSGTGGITIIDCRNMAVGENLIREMKNHGILIGLAQADRYSTSGFRISGNRISGCGYDAQGSITQGSGGIVCKTIRNLSIKACEIKHTGSSDTFGVVLNNIDGDTHVSSNRIIGYPDEQFPATEHTALEIIGVGNFEDESDGTQIVDNIFAGSGSYLLSVNLSKGAGNPRSLIFSNNLCKHKTLPIANPPASVQFDVPYGRVIMVGNDIRADDPDYASISVSTARLSAISNVTSGSWGLPPGDTLPTPVESFNHIGIGI